MDEAGGAEHAVTFSDVRAAAQRLEGVAHRTPVLTSRILNESSGCRVCLKCENFQRGGAFKFRGAYNRISQIEESKRKGGVVAFSSGNHAQGVALACKLLGVPAVIVMPADAPTSKIEATKGYGAEIIFYDRHKSHRAEIAQRLCEERGATLVPPFDDPRIIAGAGTAVLELLDEVPDLAYVVTPVGGGGLLSGSCIAAHGIDEKIELFGIEPESGNDVQQSLAAGHIVDLPVPRTIADGLQTTAPGKWTYAIMQEHGVRVVTVSDDQLRDAMRFLFERMKIVVEPSGAAGVAALLSGALPVPSGSSVGIVISGGNVDVARLAELQA